MKIAVILGSPRKKDGYRICKEIEQALTKYSSCEFEYIHLKEYHIEECKGCDQCFTKGEHVCPCKDDLLMIKERLLAADGLIFASPVYAYNLPSGMKKLIDRLSYWFHRQELVGKPVLTVITTAGGGDREVASYLKMTVSGWGCRLIGELRVKSPMYFQNDNYRKNGYNERYHVGKQTELRRIAEKFYHSMSYTQLPVPSFYDLYLFQGLRTKTFISAPDHAYWEEKGWLKQLYFYKIKLGPIKYVFSITLRTFIDCLCNNKH